MTFNEYKNPDEQSQDFLFNGKELQTDLDLDWYDYGARMYDAAIGRFGTIDPHASFYEALSPYIYVGNNPISFIDPTGMDSVSVHDLNDVPLDPENDVVILDEVVITPESDQEEDVDENTILPSIEIDLEGLNLPNRKKKKLQKASVEFNKKSPSEQFEIIKKAAKKRGKLSLMDKIALSWFGKVCYIIANYSYSGIASIEKNANGYSNYMQDQIINDSTLTDEQKR